MPLRIALQMDALARLNPTTDTTLDLARAAAEAGHMLFHYEPADLVMAMQDGATRVTAAGHPLLHRPADAFPWQQGPRETRELSSFDIVLMRQDPPFDLSYITATHILERLGAQTRVINDPKAVRDAPEKLLIAQFPQLLPPTLVTRDAKAIADFRRAQGDIVIKPLYGHGGHGVFHLREDDGNLASLLEMLAAANREPLMIQRFLPVKQLGDKRIILIDGEAVACYLRLPAQGDIRGNARAGASVKGAEMTARDKEICAILGPVLKERGLFLTGIDVIGDYVTEINVTSPTGLVTSDRLDGRSGRNRLAEQFWRRVVG